MKKSGQLKFVQDIVCQICETNEHSTNDYPTLPSFKEDLHEQAHALNSFQRPNHNPSSLSCLQFGSRESVPFAWVCLYICTTGFQLVFWSIQFLHLIKKKKTYNLGWRNHLNFSWKSDNNNAQTSQPPFQAHHNFQNSHGYAPPYAPPSRRNLEETLHVFIEKQETINTQNA